MKKWISLMLSVAVMCGMLSFSLGVRADLPNLLENGSFADGIGTFAKSGTCILEESDEAQDGDGCSALLLQECGVERATHLVASMGSDTANLLAAELASEVFGVRHVLPVVDDDSLAEILEDRGIAVICPHRICEEELFRLTGLPREEAER